MEQEKVGVRKVQRRLDAPGRAKRGVRIFARLSAGWTYEEIAHEEGLTVTRVRQIVKETLGKRPVDDVGDHAKMQMARLGPAIKLASDLIALGEIKAVGPLLKALEQLDRYQEVASADRDDEARDPLLAMINSAARRSRADNATARVAKASDPSPRSQMDEATK